MKLGRLLRPSPDGPQARIVEARPEQGLAIDLRTAAQARCVRRGASVDGARRLAAAWFPSSMREALAGGDAFWDIAREVAREPSDDARVPLDDADWLAPIDPATMRDFSAFEQHVVNARGRRGLEVHPTYYELPVYYKASTATVIGTGAEAPWPAYAEWIDYELEFALVIGRGGRDLTPDRAREHVVGVCLCNDFSARDMQFREGAVGLGPAKGKDFATALGPWIVSRDELEPDDATAIASVNGEQWSQGRLGDMLWPWPEIVAYASLGERLSAGDVIGTGTVGFGSGLELERGLQAGDRVELRSPELGTLANRIGARPQPHWAPEPKTPSHQPENGGP